MSPHSRSSFAGALAVGLLTAGCSRKPPAQVETGNDEAAWSQNRRAHFVVTAR